MGRETAVPRPVRDQLNKIDWKVAPAIEVATTTVTLIDPLDDLNPAWVRALIRILVTQHLAARLGWWPVDEQEADDAHIAHKLYATADPSPNCSLVHALQQARVHHLDGQTDSAIRFWLTADRLHRTPTPLLNVAALLCQAGRLNEASWALRAALLEPADQFPAAEVYSKARLLAAELGLLVAAQTETTRGSMVGPASGERLDPATLTIAPTPPPEVAPMTRPLPALSKLLFFEGETAPLASRKQLAPAIEASATRPQTRAFVDPIPQAPMTSQARIRLPG